MTILQQGQVHNLRWTGRVGRAFGPPGQFMLRDL